LALARYTEDIKIYESYKLAAASLQQAIIVAVGPTIQTELASLPQVLLGNFNLLSITDILHYLDATYGTHTAASIAHIHSELLFRFDSAETFASDSSKLTLLYDQLARANQGESMAKKLCQLQDNAHNIPGMTETFRAYHAAHPTLVQEPLQTQLPSSPSIFPPINQLPVPPASPLPSPPITNFQTKPPASKSWKRS
jgi:hypothetical protein